jgi:glycosyltransferase involved in cell wall biosynthesis
VPSARDHFQLLFVGSFDANWTPPDPFLNALERLARADARSLNLRFEVLGGQDRVSSERIRNFLERVGRSDLLSVRGYAAHRTAIEAMRSADALAISVAPGGYWQITAKVSEYLATEQPIVAAVPDGDCRDLLRHCGGAALFEPTDVVGLSDWLRAAAQTGEAVVERPRQPSRVAHLAAPQVASRAAALFDRVVGARGLP